MNEAMQKLAEQIQMASPIVWEAAMRQVRIEMYELLFFAIILPVAAWFAFRYARNCQKNRYDDLKIQAVFAYIASALMGFIWFPVTATLFEYFANPTYAAIKELKGLL